MNDRRDMDRSETHVVLYSFWPILLAAGIILIPIGILWLWEVSALGGVLVLTSIMGWAWESRSEPTEEERYE